MFSFQHIIAAPVKVFVHRTNQLMLLLVVGCSVSAFGQTNQCNNNAGGQIPVNNSCTYDFFDIDHNNDYWDGATGCGATDVDATWGWFTATTTSTTITYDPLTAGFDPIITIFSGACATNMGYLACVNAAGANGNETIVLPTTVGTQYRIRVQGSNNSDWLGDICVYNTVPLPPGSNTTCVAPDPICSGSPISFIANEGGADASTINPGNDYDCLFTSPNPSWYYLEIDQPGNLIIDVTAGSDVDYEIWGPFANLATAQAQCNSYGVPEDCSYSPSAIEQVVVNGVLNGEVYVLLVTNYANTVQTININEAGTNTASTNCAIVPLPVGYSSWDAVRIDSQVQLNWSTEFEENNAKFYVQRSETGSVWETIGVVNGKGDADQQNDYSFTDKQPLETMGYYRLMQVDFNGDASYTSILSVAGSSENTLKIYPNPAVGSFTIKNNGSKIDAIVLTDLVGKTYSVDYTMEENRVVVNCDNYASGSYMLTVFSNGVKMTERIFVQR
ncbi:MAG TPA: T9SS type A sorting domain-containing protein [Fluviicola sp.]|nr:T9SS type A sorting domain-containing protein [Fluviicola sp.]